MQALDTQPTTAAEPRPPLATERGDETCATICVDLALALDYPRRDTAEGARRAAAALSAGGNEAALLAVRLMELAQYLDGAAAGEPEEHYAVLFDLKPVATLHCGYHLLGDTYDRGNLLAMLAGELKRLRIPFEHDLPDYLPTLLRLLAALPEGEERALLAFPIVVPGLTKINEALAKANGPWPPVLAAVEPWLAAALPRCDVHIDLRAARRDPEVSADPFLAGVSRKGGLPCSM